jgi:parvulin-like peptidyl-prolyl isomerase
MKKFIHAAVFVAIVSVAIFFLPAADTKTNSAGASKKVVDLFGDVVLAKGPGIEVKRSEVEEQFAKLRANLAARGQPIPEDQRGMIETNLMHELIFTKLLLKRATEADRAHAAQAASNYVADLKRSLPTPETYGLRLKTLGLNESQFEAQLLEQGIRQEVIKRELGGKIVVTEDEVKKFYEQNPGRFEQPEMVRVGYVMTSTRDNKTQQPLPPDKKKEKEEIAKKVRSRAEAGDEFAKLADEFSEDPLVKTNHGEVTIQRGQLLQDLPEFEAAAFSLKTNQVSYVLETPAAFYVVKLYERIPPKKVELAKVQDQVKEMLSQQAIQREAPEYYQKLRREAGVEIAGETPQSAVLPAGTNQTQTGTPPLK